MDGKEKERLHTLLLELGGLLDGQGFIQLDDHADPGFTVHLDGHSFNILAGPDPGRFTIFTVLGDADEAQARTEVFRQALELNFEIFVSAGMGLTVEPASNQLTLVAVKHGLSRYSARNIPPVRARQMIQDGVKAALLSTKWPKPYVPKRPTTITIDLSTVDSANQFMDRHGVELVEPLKVESRGKDWMQAWNQIWHW